MTLAAAFQQLSDQLVLALRRCFIKHNANTSYVQEVLDVSTTNDVIQQLIGSGGLNPFGTTQATVTKLNQTAAIGATTIFTTPNDGISHLYRLSSFTQCVVVGTGHVENDLKYTDLVGSVITTVYAAVTLSSTGAVNSTTFNFMAEPNTVIQYQTTFTATGTYSFSLILEQLN